MNTGKTIALTRWTFVGKVMSLLFNMLSRLVISFLPRSKHLLISWLQSPSAVTLEPKKIKSTTVSPSICHEVMGLDAMILVFWMLSFKRTFSLFSFTFIKRLIFSFSCKNSKTTTPCWTTVNWRMLDPTKKIPHIQGQRRSPQQDSRRGEIAFRIKPITQKRRSEGSNKPSVQQDPETPQRLSQKCAWVTALAGFKCYIHSSFPSTQIPSQNLWLIFW